MNEEIWKPIPGYENYYVASNLGRIKSLSRTVRSGRGYKTIPDTILKPSINEWGYEQVSLSMNGNHKSQRVNRLIALTFIPNPHNYSQVNHIDGIKTNNQVDNLEWCTSSQNMRHCFDNKMSRWTTKIRIIETGELYGSITECAKHINGFVSLIGKCLRGERKTHRGFHFEIVGERASDKFNRTNDIIKPEHYKSEIIIEYKEELHSFREWSKITGIKQHTLYTRYLRGDRGDTLFRSVQTERKRDKYGKYIRQ